MTAAPTLQLLAEAALRVLARDGRRTEGEWRASLTSGGLPLDLRCSGPDLPARVPDAIAPPDLIARQRPWVGAYRLVVTAPLIVFDLYWNPAEPLRIMTFSRGDWEKELLELAE
jgi:hypothetical protein